MRDAAPQPRVVRSRWESFLQEAPQPFLACLDGPEAHMGLRAGLGLGLAAGRVCSTLPNSPALPFAAGDDSGCCKTCNP